MLQAAANAAGPDERMGASCVDDNMLTVRNQNNCPKTE